MQKLKPEGFDPLRDQAEKKLGKVKSEAQRKGRRAVISVLVLIVLIVVGMYAVGGTGEFSEWAAVRQSLSAFGKGTVSHKESVEFVKLINGVERVRGNGSALAGVYCVYALQMLSDGNNKNAAYALRVLNDEYTTKKLFSDLWDRDNLTDVCTVCASKSKGTKCSSCNGSGRRPSSGNKLKNSAGNRSASKVCIVCKGTGKIDANPALCKTCGGSGHVLSQSAVSDNQKKAMRRTKLLVNLKCLQCMLSLRPLFNRDGADD